jgi:CHAT domain-containing protein
VTLPASARVPAPGQVQSPPAPTREQTLLKEGLALFDAGKADAAKAPLQDARTLAHASGDVATEAEALRGLGGVMRLARDPSAARADYEEARRLFTSIHDLIGMGRTDNGLGLLVAAEGQWPEARYYYAAAADEFGAAGDGVDRARNLRNMTFDRTMERRERLDLLREAWETIRPLGDARNEGLILHQWGDMLALQGDYGAALEKLEAAAPLLSRAGSPVDNANVATSLGRTYRLHGLPEPALTYYEQALAIAEKTGDPKSITQALDALTLLSEEVGKPADAVTYATRALEPAKASGLPLVLVNATFVLSEAYLYVGRYTDAIAILKPYAEEGNQGKIAVSDHLYLRLDLARADAGLGRLEDAVREIDAAVAVAESHDWPLELMESLAVRATIRMRRHDAAGARVDADRALTMLERLRGTLAQRDGMKQGFTDSVAEVFTLAIDVDATLGDPAGALVVAEQARARAFQDLLETRAQSGAASAPAAGAAPAAALASKASVQPPTLADMQAVVARLRAPLLAYWVAPHETFVWVVTPAGVVDLQRVKVEATTLETLARAASTPDQPAAASAGHELRDLYDLLIKPVRATLQAQPATRLTIIPHGPLFRVSFAALTDERGRYLVERYELHYAPAVGVLRFTEKNLGHRNANRALLVADPDLPVQSGADALGPLAGARLEVADAARLLGGHPDVLTGREATEVGVRRLAGGHAVLHFATHGIVTDRSPLTSYLALARSGSDAAADGKLTAAEIYGLDLSADLVVLSACRSGAGKITGDGIIGLTRGFFYAGAPSVIATLWDLADEPTRFAMRRFYTHWRPGVSKAAALRAAQLDTIRALRAGTITADTPFGRVTLAERPSLWAAFVLLGEP